jgi:hypothetical protein
MWNIEYTGVVIVGVTRENLKNELRIIKMW